MPTPVPSPNETAIKRVIQAAKEIYKKTSKAPGSHLVYIDPDVYAELESGLLTLGLINEPKV